MMGAGELFLAIVLGVTVAKITEAVISATVMNWLMSRRPPAPPLPPPLLDAYRDGWRAAERCHRSAASGDDHIDHHYTWEGTSRMGRCTPAPAPDSTSPGAP